MRITTLLLFLTGTIGFSQINPNDACPAAALPVGTSCTPNTYTMAGSFANGALIAPSCPIGTNRDDGWYSFVATATDMTVEEVSTNRTHLIEVWDACGAAATTSYGCASAAAGVTNVLSLSGLAIGTTYYIQLQRRSGFNGSSMTGSICVYSNPDPDVAWPGADLGTLSCASISNISNNTSGASVDCASSSAGDHIYQFTIATSADVVFELCGSSYDTEVRLYNLTDGSCDGAPISSNDDFCGVQSQLSALGLAAGTYVIVVEGSGAAEGAYDMNISVSNCGGTAPSNDSPCTATPLSVNATCTTTTGDNTGANDSGIADPGCANYGGADVWYTATVPAGGQIIVETSAGGITNGGLAIYSGSCGDLTLINCDNNSGTGNMEYIEELSLTPGETIYIRVWEFNGDAEGTFDICVYEPDCSANTTNDYCEDPGELFFDGSSSFSSSTAALYTYDNPDGVESIFCGTIQNNSWYQFTATQTTHTFDITAVVGCANGIQAEVYSYNSAGNCCSNFTSVSNCFNPGTAATGVVTATPLTIGETYILMIDGWAGANCDFTIDGWSATNILPIELVNFECVKKVDHNQLRWETKSELNNDYFLVEKSYDGVYFESIRKINGAGNSSVNRQYVHNDHDISYQTVYYRLRQVDFDGEETFSNVLTVKRDPSQITIYPNPTSGTLNIDFASHPNTNFTLHLTDALGQTSTVTFEKDTYSSTVYSLDAMEDLPGGIYFVRIDDEFGNEILNERVIRN